MMWVEVESEFEFVGFIIFENKFKFIIVGVLKELKMFNIGFVMVMGDNILIVISVVWECGLIECNVYCFVLRFI